MVCHSVLKVKTVPIPALPILEEPRVYPYPCGTLCTIPPYLVNLRPQAPQLLCSTSPTSYYHQLVELATSYQYRAQAAQFSFFGLFWTFSLYGLLSDPQCSKLLFTTLYYVSTPVCIYTNTEHPAFCILQYIVYIYYK